VQPGHEAAVGQVDGVGRVTLVQLDHTRRPRRPVAQAVGQEHRQRLRRGVGLQVAEHRGQPVGRIAQAVEQHGAPFFGRVLLGLAPEAAQKRLAFAVGKAGQVVAAPRVAGILEQARGAARHLVHGVAHHLAHQPHEGQVDGGLHRLAQGGLAAVVVAVEVAEGVDAPPGEEGFGRAGGKAPLQGGFEHGAQAAIVGRGEVLHGPAPQGVLAVHRQGAQLGRWQRRQALVLLGHQLEVGGQHTQLGGGAQFELAALVDVERLAGGVGLDTHEVAVWRVLPEREAVPHVGHAGRLQHPLTHQPLCTREGGVGQALQVAGHGRLQRAVQSGAQLGVEAVQAVEGGAQQAGQAVAHRHGALACLHRCQRRVAGHVAESQRLGQRGIAPVRGDQAFGGHQAQVGVGGGVEVLAALPQVPRGAAVRDHQCDGLAQHPATRGRIDRARGQRGLGVGQLGAEPDPQAIPQSIDLAMPRRRRQRHGVEVVEHGLAPHRQRRLALAVGPYRGRRHLAQLLLRVVGDATGGMPVLFDLGGQGAAAWGVHLGVELAADLANHRTGEADPVDRRVHVGSGVVQQIAVFDEQQRLHQHRRHRLEGFELAVRVAEGIDRLAGAAVHREPGLGFLGVGGKQPQVQVVQQGLVVTGLFGDGVAARLQPLGEQRYLGVTQPLIERAMRREADAVARAGGDFVTEGGGVARGPAGLPMRGVHLPPHRGPQRHDQHQEHRPAPSPQGPPPHAWRHCRCAANTALGYSARPRLPL